jgi:hypothetical protein
MPKKENKNKKKVKREKNQGLSHLKSLGPLRAFKEARTF